MAAWIQRFELEIHIDFFTGLNRRKNWLSVFLLEFAPVQINAVLRVDPITMPLEQPVHAVRRAAFFVGSQSKNQIAVRQEAFLLQADEIRDQDGVTLLHVLGAPSIEEAVFFNEFEGIRGPIGPERLHYIQMPDKQDWLAVSGSAEAHHQILLTVIRPVHVKVILGKTRVAKALRHSFGGSCHVADGIGGVDLDKLLENVSRHLVDGVRTLRPGWRDKTGNPRQHQHRANRSTHWSSSQRESRKG